MTNPYESPKSPLPEENKFDEGWFLRECFGMVVLSIAIIYSLEVFLKALKEII